MQNLIPEGQEAGNWDPQGNQPADERNLSL